jgi:ribosomal protein S12 methylthiotransferase accessory factor
MSRSQLESVLTATAALRDPLGGVVGRLNELPRLAGHPRLFHYSADRAGQQPIGVDLRRANHYDLLPNVPGAGVSADPLEAQVRATAEAIERYCMSVYSDAQFITATAEELGDEAMDLDTIPRCDPSEQAVASGIFAIPRKDVPMRWMKAISLIDGGTYYVPAIMVYLFFPPISREENVWAPISTGCATHVDLDRALVSALCEVIERDALMLTWLHQLPLPRIDLGPVEALPAELQSMLALMRESNLRYEFFDATTDLGVPTIYALQLSDETDLLANLVVSATKLDPVNAILRTLEEGCSSRIALESRMGPGSSRERMAKERIISLEDCALYYGDRASRSDFDFLRKSGRSCSLSALPKLATGDPQSDLQGLLDVFRRRKMQVFAVDLTTPEVRDAGFWSVRTIVPELMPLSSVYGIRFLGTKRLYDAPSAMGYGTRTIADITPKPQPFA